MCFSPELDLVLDWSLVVFHSALTLFNLTGWIWRRTRPLHLMVIGLTFLSWLGLGMFLGWGYCPFTDWHWQVKTRLGETGLPDSYIKYYLDKLSGVDLNALAVDVATVSLASAALLLSCWLNWRDYKAEKLRV